MIFYEDFIKRLQSSSLDKETIKDKEIFGLELKKKIGIYGIAIPILLIAIYQGYRGYVTGMKPLPFFISIILFFLGTRQLKIGFAYKIKIDTKEETLTHQALTIDLKKVNDATLKEVKIGKSLAPSIDILFDGNKRVLIPLFMNDKIRFVLLLQHILKDKFIISK